MENMSKLHTKTLFIDLDGTLVIHNYHPTETNDTVIGHAIHKLINWKKEGNVVVLTTARSREHTAMFVRRVYDDYGFVFDHILCGLPTGERILVNDSKDGTSKATAVQIARNEGIDGIWL